MIILTINIFLKINPSYKSFDFMYSNKETSNVIWSFLKGVALLQGSIIG